MADGWEPDSGTAGASARRESERQREARELAASGMGIRRLLAKVLGPSAADRRRLAREKAFAIGGRGEEMLAESLARRCPDVALLHDRCLVRRGRANIDHLAIAASDVYVIDTKRYRGKIKVRKPWFRDPVLRIDGRDRTNLIQGLERQVAAFGQLSRASRRTSPSTAVFVSWPLKAFSPSADCRWLERSRSAATHCWIREDWPSASGVPVQSRLTRSRSYLPSLPADSRQRRVV